MYTNIREQICSRLGAVQSSVLVAVEMCRQGEQAKGSEGSERDGSGQWGAPARLPGGGAGSHGVLAHARFVPVTRARHWHPTYQLPWRALTLTLAHTRTVAPSLASPRRSMQALLGANRRPLRPGRGDLGRPA